MPSRASVLVEPATPTSTTAGTRGKHSEAQSEDDIRALLQAMCIDIASLHAVQNAANKEIMYLRMNTDRIARDAGSEIRRMRKHLRMAQAQIRQMDDVQNHLQRKLRQYQGSPTPTQSPSPPPQAPLRRVALRRQGAFSGPLEDISWAALNDVRGLDPNAPRYHHEHGEAPNTTQSKKRPHAAVDGSDSEEAPLSHNSARYEPSTALWASNSKRRRMFPPARAVNPSPPSASAGFIASIFSM